MNIEGIDHSPIEPAGDSRPIKFEALLAHEVDLISKANRLLRGMHNDVRQPQSVQDPWAVLDYNRRYRTLMISGVRGTGKTSIMLTLLAGWRAAWSGEWKTISVSHQEEAKRLFGDMAQVVRPLKPLDFDPLPPDLPLYGWIVQAFLPLVEWLEQDGRAEWDRGFDREIRDSRRSRDRLSWSEQPKTLREQWRDLYQAAVVGWGTGKLREAFQKDLYDLMLDQEGQHLNWQKLQDRWQRFLNDLFKELDQRQKGNVFPPGGLLVLPIDDADLQIERDRELIFAVRLLHHPRVVYLLTGDIFNLQHNLRLDFLSRMIRDYSIGDPQGEFFDIYDERSRDLARDLVKKVFSPSNVLSMGALNLRQVLEWNDKEQDKPLDKIFLKGDFSFRQFLKKRPVALDFSALTFRTLQQFKDQYTHIWDLNTAPNLANFLERLAAFLELLVGDPDEFTIGRVSEEQIVLHTFPGSIVPVTPIYQSARHMNVEVRVGVELDFKQVWITEEPIRFVQASPLTLLALDLAVEAPHVYVHQHTPRIQQPQCLAWSVWYSAPYAIWLPWPSIGANRPTETVRRVEDWARDVRNIDPTGDAAWVDRIAFTWIRLHLLWLGAGKDQLPEPLETDSDMNDAWDKLFQAFKSLEDDVRRLQWFQLELPLLTAPEYGLSKDIQERLLQALLEAQGAQELPETWQESRLKSTDTAKRFTQGQEPVDWFEVNPYDLELGVSDSMFDLLDDIKKAFPDSPWSHEPPHHNVDAE